MIFDSTRTKSYKDKVKVWFSSPKWRPADVEKEFPIIKNDLENFEPYDPEISNQVQIYGWTQLLFLLITFASITMTLGAQNYLETSIFACALVISCTIVLMALEKFDLKVFPEFIKSFFVIIFFAWSGLINPELLVSKLFIAQSVINIVLMLILSTFPEKFFTLNLKTQKNN